MAKKLYLSEYTGSLIEGILDNNKDTVSIKAVGINSLGEEVIRYFRLGCFENVSYISIYDGVDWTKIDVEDDTVTSEHIQDLVNTLKISFGKGISIIGINSINGLLIDELNLSHVSALLENSITDSEIGTLIISAELNDLDNKSLLECISSCVIDKLKVNSNNTAYNSNDNCNAVVETSTGLVVLGSNNTILTSSMTGIASKVFKNNTSITAVNFPDTIETIGDEAYSGCSNLNLIKFTLTNAPSIGENAFDGVSEEGQLWIPSQESLEDYQEIIELFPEDWELYCLDTNYPVITNMGEVIEIVMDINGTDEGIETTKSPFELVEEILGNN